MPSEPAITLIRSPQLTQKAPYVYAAVTAPGRFVFTAGTTVTVGDFAGSRGAN